jgi:ubiquinone/menaquinone biosynthesis C-methylase UbiE
MHDKQFTGDMNRLRSSERVEILEVDRVIELCLESQKIERVLDVGTGTGLFAEAFLKRGKETYGIDINPDMLNEARRWAPEAGFKVADFDHIPYADNFFDLSFAATVFHESSDYLTTLTELRRVTARRIAILDWPCVEEPTGPPLHHRFSKEVLIETAEKAGIDEVRVIPQKRLILYLMDLTE